jgi:hypothetical protein
VHARDKEEHMTTTPRLPASLAYPAATTETEATEAELDRMLQLALQSNARVVRIGHGRSPAAARAARAFACRWEAAGRIVLCAVTWPEEAASWLRQATRFTAANPDLWVMAGPAGGWAQMTRRLLWSTSWRPERTIAFAGIGTGRAIGLVGAVNLPGLTGATNDGGTWAVRDGQLEIAAQSTEAR